MNLPTYLWRRGEGTSLLRMSLARGEAKATFPEQLFSVRHHFKFN
jgi:hypothetical protein